MNNTHYLERTSPTGPGKPFFGKCVKCGKENLPITAALDECVVVSDFTQDIVDAIERG